MADYDTQLAQFMSGVRREESGGNYAIHPNRAGASGAYQFTKGTWQGTAGPYARLYPEAWMAPPAIQDEVARQLMGSYYRQFGGDWSKVAEAWLAGPGNVGKNLSDGNTTEQAYARNVLAFAGLSGSPPGSTAGPTSTSFAAAGAPVTVAATAQPAGPDLHNVDVQAQTILGLLSRPATNAPVTTPGEAIPAPDANPDVTPTPASVAEQPSLSGNWKMS